MGDIISQIFGIIKKIIILAIIIGVPMMIIRCASPKLYQSVVDRAILTVDSTTLYAYSKDAYLESIVQGHRNIYLYTIVKETPFYTSILAKEKLEDAEPLGKLPPNVVVELRNVIRRGENVWIPAFFYSGDKSQYAYALFPREWEQNAVIYDKEKKLSAINTEYETYVKKNFELMEVKPEEEKEYKEKYNDYYMIRGMRGDNHFYAPKTDKAKIDKVYNYYLNQNNINMLILQTDKEWERPALVLDKPEEEK